MRSIVRRLAVLASYAVWLPFAAAQSDAPQVAIVGASVSAGFKDGILTHGAQGNDTVPLLKLLRPRFDVGRVATYADEFMFLDADGSGERQVKHVVRLKPDLLVAVDFLFWFSHGPVPHGMKEADYRKDHLDVGLAMLARCEGPLLVGDLPDMHGASERMLNPAWIPEPALLAALNGRLYAWAKERKNVTVFPLAAEVKALKETGVVLPLADGPLKTGPSDLLQGDRLHPTRLGMAWLCLRLDQELAKFLPKDSPLEQGPKWTLANYIEAAGAETDLEAARAKAKDKDQAKDKAKEPAPAGKG
jgi:hypothetical protein